MLPEKTWKSSQRACHLVFLFLATLLLVGACAQPASPESNNGGEPLNATAIASIPMPDSTGLSPVAATPSTTTLRTAAVVDVISGDTILVDYEGVLFKVKYIGIDTPAANHPVRGDEPHGKEALKRNRQLVQGKYVHLEADLSQTDALGRFLRYVYVDGVIVNMVLLREGHGKLTTLLPDVTHTEELEKAQQEALLARRGIWASGTTKAGG